MQPTASQIADALENLDWRDTPIGHKAILRAAIAKLREVDSLPTCWEARPKEYDDALPR